MRRRKFVKRIQWPLSSRYHRAGSIQNSQPIVQIRHTPPVLGPYSAVVDADVVDQAGEEGLRRHDCSAADVQTTVARVHGNICVFGDENVVYMEPAIRAVYGRFSVSSNGLWRSCGREQH